MGSGGSVGSDGVLVGMGVGVAGSDGTGAKVGASVAAGGAVGAAVGATVGADVRASGVAFGVADVPVAGEAVDVPPLLGLTSGDAVAELEGSGVG